MGDQQNKAALTAVALGMVTHDLKSHQWGGTTLTPQGHWILGKGFSLKGWLVRAGRECGGWPLTAGIRTGKAWKGWELPQPVAQPCSSLSSKVSSLHRGKSAVQMSRIWDCYKQASDLVPSHIRMN